jgi:methyl-accepting chemotaxis protein
MSLSVRAKLMGGFVVVLALMGISLTVGVIANANATAITDRIVTHLDPARQAAARIVTLVRAIDDDGAWAVNARFGDEAHSKELLATYYQEVDELQVTVDRAFALADSETQRQAIEEFKQYYWGSTPLTAADRATLDSESRDVFKGSDSYLFANEQVFAMARSGKVQEAAFNYTTVPFVGALDSAQIYIDEVEASIRQAIADGNAAATVSKVSSVGLGLLAVLLGLAVAFLLSRSIARGVKDVQTAMLDLAEQTGHLSDALGAFAANDLTVALQPKSTTIDRYGTDEIGRTAATANELAERVKSSAESYELARASLAGALGEVRLAADGVAATSKSLSEASSQSGNAIGQIANTINHVAVGASDQARGAERTAIATRELGDVITRVGSGAASTATSVGDVGEALDKMAQAISSASDASARVRSVVGDAATAAETGGDSVERAVEGMDRIRQVVTEASAKVTELGSKSDQIGAIVGVIDDIAEQTNLLALNAAIEAARAGEQGKGFAVVADEVRKLAERSSLATKEIANLIGEVQTGTTEAVRAMEAGAIEVEKGSEVAHEAGASLKEIARAVQATRDATNEIAEAVTAMDTASSGVVAASDSISRIAGETNAAATQMTSSAETLGSAVESIAALAEENSASAQEVSAATEEMSAQAEEVVASAGVLSDMASDLNALVGRFRIEGEASRAVPAGVERVDRAPGPRVARAA